MEKARVLNSRALQESKKPLLVAVTGASGAVYALKFLELMREQGQEVHMVMSEAAVQVCSLELGEDGLQRLLRLSARTYDVSRFDSSPASGSSRWRAMVIIPCSMGTLGTVVHGISLNLIHRAADCFLKEQRPLVAVVRETPLNPIHLRNLLKFSQAGGVVFPAMPAFYSRPSDLDEMVSFFVGRLAEFLGFEVKGLPVWQGID